MHIMSEHNEIDAEMEAKFRAMPGYLDLIGKLVNFEDLPLKRTVQLMKTAAYCHLDATELVERFVWLCGGNSQLFYKYFTDDGLAGGVDPIIRDLLIEHGYDTHTDAEIGVRFRWIDICDAARCANLKLLKHAYVHKPGEFKSTQILCSAASSISPRAPECIKFLRQVGCPWSSEVAVGAIEKDLIDNFRTVHEAGFITDSETIADGIMCDSIACITYAHEQKMEFPADAVYTALNSNSIRCLRFLHSVGWEIPADALDVALMRSAGSCAEHLLSLGSHVSSETISYLVEKDSGYGIYMLANAGITFEPYHVMKAVLLRRFDMVSMMCNGGYKPDFTIFIEPILLENLEVMEKLVELKFPMDVALCNIAAQLGKRRALEFLHEHGCPWDATTYVVSAAAIRKYLQDSGCPLPTVAE